MEDLKYQKAVQFSMSLPEFGNVNQLKGILKAKSDPLMLCRVEEEEEEGVEAGGEGTSNATGNGSRNVMNKSTGKFAGMSVVSISSIEDGAQQNGPVKQSSQEYENPAFIEDELHLKDDLKHFSDVVEHVTGESTSATSNRTDLHPFGRNTIFEEILGDKTKHTSVESGILVIWVLFAVCLVGMAGGIIFLAEKYELDKTEQMKNSSLFTNNTF